MRVGVAWRHRARDLALFPRAFASQRVTEGASVNGSELTCARWGMTVRFMPGALNFSEMPSSWDEVNGAAYCLSCRRKMAGEARAAMLRVEDEEADPIRADAEGRVEFELDRSPDRCDTRIARACGTNVIVVRQVRERLGAYPTRPV